MMNNVLDVSGLSKSYPNFTLKDISFTLPVGYMMGLIGPNGSGKTTTIKSILNMITPDSGCVSIFERDYALQEQEIKKNVGVVFDSNYFVDEWSMSDVEKAYALFYDAWSSETYWSLLSKFRISKEKQVRALSKGMQMKLMLACAFSYDAKLLILDEPTSGLDPVSRDELLAILSAYIEDGQHSVLFSTHITSDLEKIADYITYINLGSLVFTGSKEAFIDGYRIVTGDKNQLVPELQEKLIGLRAFSTGYEALIRTEDLHFAAQAKCIDATIDDIVVFISRQTEKTQEGFSCRKH